MPRKTKPVEDEIIAVSSPLSVEDQRLEKLFDDMESGSMATLDNAARQIITLSTALLGAFFGLLAFKDTPKYLGYIEIKVLGGIALLAFLVSLLLALRAVTPQRYEVSSANLTAKRKLLHQMLSSMDNNLRWASWIFGIGALLMLAAALDILIFRI